MRVYGYKDAQLKKYVDERLAEHNARLERAEARQERSDKEELSRLRSEITLLAEKLDKANVTQMADADSENERSKPVKLPIPKFEDRQDVQRYLETFESLAKVNGYKESDWLLALKSAVMGTKLFFFNLFSRNLKSLLKALMTMLRRSLRS